MGRLKKWSFERTASGTSFHHLAGSLTVASHAQIRSKWMQFCSYSEMKSGIVGMRQLCAQGERAPRPGVRGVGEGRAAHGGERPPCELPCAPTTAAHGAA
eukprot:5076862-Prymnesium_polylepis.2